MSRGVKGSQTPEGMAFTQLCERADADPEAAAKVQQHIEARKREIQHRNIQRKLAERPRHSRYDTRPK